MAVAVGTEVAVGIATEAMADGVSTDCIASAKGVDVSGSGGLPEHATAAVTSKYAAAMILFLSVMAFLFLLLNGQTE